MEAGRVMCAAPGAVLVIGYGSALRGDDAVGRFVVEAVERWQHPDVKVVSVTQLLPELAEGVARARAVIFVDACADEDIDEIRVRELAGDASNSGHTHYAAPLDIVRLAKMCFGRAPRAWLVAVGAREFALTNKISTAAQANAAAAVDAIAKLVDDALSEPHSKHSGGND